MNRSEPHPHELLRRAEQFVTVAFLVTSQSERGELDRHELDALNSVLGDGMMMLRQAYAAIEATGSDRPGGTTDAARMNPRDAG